MWAWQRGGQSDSVGHVEWAEVLIDPSLRAQPQTLASDSSPGKGYILMRSGFDTPMNAGFCSAAVAAHWPATITPIGMALISTPSAIPWPWIQVPERYTDPA